LFMALEDILGLRMLFTVYDHFGCL
jgi:hypothetical protein